MDTVDEVKYEGYDIKVYQDECPNNPREDDNLGVIICFHKRYKLGDENKLNSEMFGGWDELEKYIRKELKASVVLPLYLYDHSGITINTTGFSCPWDSGRVGFCYVTNEAIKKEYGKLNQSTKNKAKKVLVGEIKTYDEYLTGEVYGFKIMLGDEEIDSCWGYFGDTKNMIEECKGTIDSDIKQRNIAKSKKLKSLIINKVPLDKRVLVQV